MTPLSLIIHGDSGNGKSTLALSGPGPRLVIDAESGAQHAHRVLNGEIEMAKIVRWRPPEPIPESVEDTCIVSVSSFKELDPIISELQNKPHPFKTIVVDSVTEIQEYLHGDIRGEVGREQFQKQDWGLSKTRFTSFVREVRDLVDHPTNPVHVVVFTALTVEKGNPGNLKKWPDLQGGAFRNFPASVDVTGYVAIRTDENGDDEQAMLIHGNPSIIAKTRSPLIRKKWGNVITDPNLSDIFDSLQ